jgi:predicted Zn-dependent protease
MICFSCSRNAITGENQLSLVSEDELQQMSLTQYKQFLSQSKVIQKRMIMQKWYSVLANALPTPSHNITKQKGIANNISNYKWEFNLVESKEVNAWCMPGGKVVVYTGY